jgi:Rha family phage regulatory protein
MDNKNLPVKILKNEVSDFFIRNDGAIFISSLYVEKVTGKKHHNIMRDIREIIKSDKDFAQINFDLCQYSSNRNNLYDFYWMTENGIKHICNEIKE